MLAYMTESQIERFCELVSIGYEDRTAAEDRYMDALARDLVSILSRERKAWRGVIAQLQERHIYVLKKFVPRGEVLRYPDGASWENEYADSRSSSTR